MPVPAMVSLSNHRLRGYDKGKLKRLSDTSII